MTSPSKTNEHNQSETVRPIVDDARRAAPRGVPRRRRAHRQRAAPPMGVTIDDARLIAATLPRSYEALVRDQVRFRVGRMVYAAFYHDDTIMGFGFPRDEREALVASEPDKFLMPRPSDIRYQWVCVQLNAIDVDELRELLDRRVAHVRTEEGGCRLRGLTAPTGGCSEGRRATDRCPNKTRLDVAQQVPPNAGSMALRSARGYGRVELAIRSRCAPVLDGGQAERQIGWRMGAPSGGEGNEPTRRARRRCVGRRTTGERRFARTGS